MKDNSLKLIIAGFGGQGVLFAGKLIAQSAMRAHKHVTWFPSYGAEIRGGTANCTVIVSDEMIGSPVVRSPNILVLMNQASLDRFEQYVKPGGLLLINSSLITKSPARRDVRVISIRATDIANDLGNAQAANMVMLGALVRQTAIVSQNAVYRALEEITPEHRKGTLAVNRSAFNSGVKDTAGQKSHH